MKARGLVLFLILGLPLLILGCSLIQPKEPPVYTQVFPKTGWIEDFASGRSEPGSEQIKEAKKIRDYLQQEENLKIWIALKGSVDNNKFKNGCHTTQDGLNFFPGPGSSEKDTIYDDLKCEIALGYSRALHIQAIITDWPFHNYGVGTYRVHAFPEVDFYKRTGEDYKNRSVGYWYIILPANAKIQKLVENAETGELVVSYIEVHQTWWERLKEKQSKGELFKSRIKEKREPKS